MTARIPNSELAYGQTVVNQVVRCARYWFRIALGAFTCPVATGDSTAQSMTTAMAVRIWAYL